MIYFLFPEAATVFSEATGFGPVWIFENVLPANAGIHKWNSLADIKWVSLPRKLWAPACAGETEYF